MTRLQVEQGLKRNWLRIRAGKDAVEGFRDKMTMEGCIHTLFIICAALAALGCLWFVCLCRKVFSEFLALIKLVLEC